MEPPTKIRILDSALSDEPDSAGSVFIVRCLDERRHIIIDPRSKTEVASYVVPRESAHSFA